MTWVGGARSGNGHVRVREDDRELIEKAKKGDEGAYRVLLSRYERAVYNICYRMVRDKEEARDLAQEAFMKVFAMLDRYNPSYAFSNWLLKITSNLCIDAMRKRRIDTLPMDEPIRSARGDIERQYASPMAAPDKTLLDKERMALLRRAIDNLPDHYRIMIVLRHQEDRTYDDIARILDLPLGTVKARIHRAREMLKNALEGEDIW
jgi:RNA polymerase sigma factor (sigma-70 family)